MIFTKLVVSVSKARVTMARFNGVKCFFILHRLVHQRKFFSFNENKRLSSTNFTWSILEYFVLFVLTNFDVIQTILFTSYSF